VTYKTQRFEIEIMKSHRWNKLFLYPCGMPSTLDGQ
jgi:hypothetical protein